MRVPEKKCRAKTAQRRGQTALSTGDGLWVFERLWIWDRVVSPLLCAVFARHFLVACGGFAVFVGFVGSLGYAVFVHVGFEFAVWKNEAIFGGVVGFFF